MRRQFGFRFIFGLPGGIVSFILMVFVFPPESQQPEVSYTLGIALWMAVWWVTEVVPLAVTSLLPVVLFPLMGVMDGKDVSSAYFNHVIFLFIGGFLVALAMQRWNLHRRIALRILMLTGSSPPRILLGFMLATGFLSMWISNTATAMLMVPIVLSVITQLENSSDGKAVQKYAVGLLLGVAFSASIGGIATLVGTPPNLSFARIFAIMFPDAPDISFSRWFVFALPVSFLAFLITWIYLLALFPMKKSDLGSSSNLSLRKQYADLGKMTFEEKVVLANFLILAILWLTRADISLGDLKIQGWSSIFAVPEYINDGTVAILMSLILFIIPSKKPEKGTILTWDTASKIPWHIVLLFGGGFALAGAFKESGLSLWFGQQLEFVGNFHPLIIIAVICFLMTFLTELTSNTATTEMILPVLAGLAISTETHPLLFMIPATLSGSMAFMLPVATPPNAIIFGTNRLKVIQMARTGFLLNLVGIILVTLAVWYWGATVFNINPDILPAWTVSG